MNTTSTQSHQSPVLELGLLGGEKGSLGLLLLLLYSK